MRKAQASMVIAGFLLFSLTASAEYNRTPKVMNKIDPLPSV